ncbi:MAG: Rrf2 family transcriptional regulator [Spirochaetales bacterium]|nr:Rrf2 family transcriptional regulator [Spirochaetales bacterium]
MFRFNKDMEYALISLVEMSRLPEDELVSARELSERYSIPFKLLARILQKLGSDGIVAATKGPKGGYRLTADPQKLTLGTVIRAVRGDERIADCLEADGHCAQEDCGCIIKPIVRVFQEKWVAFVENTTLDEFAAGSDNPADLSPVGAPEGT